MVLHSRFAHRLWLSKGTAVTATTTDKKCFACNILLTFVFSETETLPDHGT